MAKAYIKGEEDKDRYEIKIKVKQHDDYGVVLHVRTNCEEGSLSWQPGMITPSVALGRNEEVTIVIEPDA